MKKWLILVLCVLALCLAAAPALADSWDFLHSAFRLTASADMELLAKENGLTMSRSEASNKLDYLISGITIEALTPTTVHVVRDMYSPIYDCALVFSSDSNASKSVDLAQVYLALRDILTTKYGTPTPKEFWTSSQHIDWQYRDATISLYFFESGGQYSGEPYIQISYNTRSFIFEPDVSWFPAFPYPATDYAAKAHEEASRPFSFRNGVQGGMTMDQVIAAEGRQPDERTDGSLTYSGLTIDGRDATLLYRFASDYYDDAYEDEEDTIAETEAEETWLAYAQVLFNKAETDKDAYVAAYKAVDQELAGKFSPDFFGDGQWYVPWAYEQDGSGSEREMCTSWIIQDVVIAHILEIRGSKLLHGILYTFYEQSNCEPEVDVLTWPEDMLAWGD